MPSNTKATLKDVLLYGALAVFFILIAAAKSYGHPGHDEPAAADLPATWPGTTNLEVTEMGAKVCEAVLISHTAALTAAHCDGDAVGGSRILAFHRLSDLDPVMDLAVVTLENRVSGIVFEIAEDYAPAAIFYSFSTKAPVRKGNSGGPVLAGGKLVGILTAHVPGNPRRGWAINVSRFKNWIESKAKGELK